MKIENLSFIFPIFQSCLLYYYHDASGFLPFINCMAGDFNESISNSAYNCAAKLGTDWSHIDLCMNSDYGNGMQHGNAVQTESLNPPHKYVPWVTLNGVHTEEIQQEAEKDLVKLICQTYQVYLMHD